MAFGTQCILGTWGNRYSKQYDRFKAFRDERGKVWDDLVQTSAVLVRERRDKCFLVRLIGDEKRVYEHGLVSCQ
jgi:hypothetical protein